MSPAWVSMLLLIALGITLLFSSKALAKAPPGHRPIHLSSELPMVKVGDYAALLVDPTGTLNLPEVKRAYAQGQFQKSQSDLDFGFTRDAVWLRVELENPGDKDTAYILDTSYPLIDNIQYHELDRAGSLVRERILGDQLPFYDRDFLIRSFAYQLTVPAHGSRTMYIRVQSSGSVSVPFKAYLFSEFGRHLHQSSLILGVFYGVILGLSLYNLFLWYLTKDNEHLLYSMLAISNLGFAVSIDGVSFMFFPELIGWQQVTVYVWLCSCSGLGISFASSFFDVATHFPRTHKVMRGLNIVFAVSAVALIGTQSVNIFPVVLLATLISMPIAVGVALRRLAQGYAPARTYLIAWSGLLFAVFFGVLSSVKVIGAYSLTPYIQKMGIVLEMFLLAIAVANKIKLLRSQKQRAVQAADAAQAQSKAKSDFLAKMSHEIRTPMNGVLGMAEILRDSPLDDSQANCVSTIQTSGQALLDVINDILDYSKIEAGKMSLEERFFDLEVLLDDIQSIFFNVSQEKKIPLIIHLDPSLVLSAKGDETRLRQVLINLVGNAYKFTSHGSITVSVRPCPTASTSLLFSVKDTGIGIEKSAQDRLFDSFSQEDSSVTRQYGGTGLGLAICAQLVSLMGGSIELRSEKGQGSEFFFTLPTSFNPNARSLIDLTKSHRPSHAEEKVLFLATGDRHAPDVQDTLGTWGLPIEARDFLQRPQNIQELSKFDLVILHESVSSSESTEFIDLVSEVPGNKPNLLIRSHKNLPIDCSKQPSDRRIKTLIAPSGRKLTRTAIFELLDEPSLQSERKSEQHQPRQEQDYSELHVLVAEDNKVNQAVVKGMLARFSITPTIVNNGREALQAYEQASPAFDLIFMDCEMPEMDGYQATMKIREQPNRGEDPVLIIALTAHALAEHRDRATQAGMDDHLTKPLSIDALRQALANASSKLRSAA